MVRSITQAALAALVHSPFSLAQTSTAPGACATVLAPDYNKPVVGAGYTAQLIVNDVKGPRGIVFDANGALLVVQKDSGIKHITFNDNGGTCLSVKESKTLLDLTELNHAIELSDDGKTLYASSSDKVYSWEYDAGAVSLSKDKKTLVQNMTNDDHVSRTLMLSKKSKNMLLVSRGSDSNMDMATRQIDSGRSQIRAFDISNLPDGKPYDYASGGKVIGWGLRNSVGVAEEPMTGGIFSVENSADMVKRGDVDIHQDDPGEELNFHGFLNGTSDNQGGNYGYPDCFAVWGTNIPDKGNMTVGSQFALSKDGDAKCASDYVPPRITFQAHMAPLDIKFTSDGSEAYVSFHGSWNRDDPVGYKLSVMAFKNGQPTEPPSSTTATKDILTNPDLSACPDKCFRPVGLAIDKKGRIFMSSDATGEIYVLQKAEMSATQPGGGNSPTNSGGGTLVTSTTPPNAGSRSARGYPRQESLWLAAMAVGLSVVGGAMLVAA